jgi:colicin import membrane protein
MADTHERSDEDLKVSIHVAKAILEVAKEKKRRAEEEAEKKRRAEEAEEKCKAKEAEEQRKAEEAKAPAEEAKAAKAKKMRLRKFGWQMRPC